MKFATVLVTLCASLASAGVVITKVTKEQIVVKNDDDCYFGVTTPQGCAPFRD